VMREKKRMTIEQSESQTTETVWVHSGFFDDAATDCGHAQTERRMICCGQSL
jgi:hypothetical protein